MNLYSNVLFVHILSALALFIGYGLEWTVSALLRHSSTTDQVRAWLRVYRVSAPVTGVSLAVLILSGGWLAAFVLGLFAMRRRSNKTAPSAIQQTGADLAG